MMYEIKNFTKPPASLHHILFKTLASKMKIVDMDTQDPDA